MEDAVEVSQNHGYVSPLNYLVQVQKSPTIVLRHVQQGLKVTYKVKVFMCH